MNQLTKEKVNDLYWNKQLSIRQICKEMHLCYTSVKNCLPRRRTPREGLKIVWKGHHSANYKGKVKCSNGYLKVYKPDHTRAMADGYVYEHILVWEKYHQKSLPKGWVIHHINGIKDDNRPDNLISMPKGKHRDIIPMLAKKVRELELENSLLRESLQRNQSIFLINEN